MKITIVGPGKVGTSIAYQIVANGLCDELALVGSNSDRVEGELLDLNHCQPFFGKQVALTSNHRFSDIIVYCANRSGSILVNDREELLVDNAAMLREHAEELSCRSPGATWVMITNPVDAMTSLAALETGIDVDRIVGVGTLIDSARFRCFLASRINLHPDDVRAYIIGEHGSAQFHVADSDLMKEKIIGIKQLGQDALQETKDGGFRVYKKKGHTNHAIATATIYLIRCIVENADRLIPLSVDMRSVFGPSVGNVSLSLPVVMGRTVKRVISPSFEPEQAEIFYAAMEKVRTQLRKIDAYDGP